MVQETVPVGVTPGPDTVAVKLKLPPSPRRRSVMTPVLLAALEMEAVVS